LAYKEKQIRILEAIEWDTHTKTIKFFKVQWSHHTEEEAAWERRENLLDYHPYLFASLFEARGRASFQGG
jgi:hypothetical protein